MNVKNFYNAFQNQKSKNFATDPRHINSPKQINFLNPNVNHFIDNNPKNNPNYRHHSTEKSKNNFINSLGKNYTPNSPYQSANSIKVNNNRV